MSLFQRTIKLVLATCLAIWMAQIIGLSYATSAGIIAILSVLDTRRSSFSMAWSRLLSTILALFLAVISFQLLGYHLSALTLYLLLYVPLAYLGNLAAGIAPSTVLVTHLWLEQSTSLTLLANELLLFLLGAGVALVANLYMPSQDKKIQFYHQQVQEQLKAILLRFQQFLISGDGRNDAQLIGQLDQTLQEALEIVYLDRHNQVFHQTNYQVHYFEMRQTQNRILRDMAHTINNCQMESQESLMLAELFEKTSQQLSQTNSAKDLLAEIDHYLESFRQRELPKTRAEFETRALLLQLLRDLETFIQVKVDFYHNYAD